MHLSYRMTTLFSIDIFAGAFCPPLGSRAGSCYSGIARQARDKASSTHGPVRLGRNGAASSSSEGVERRTQT